MFQVRELATRLETLKKRGEHNSFVFVDLKKCAILLTCSLFSFVFPLAAVSVRRYLPSAWPEFVSTKEAEGEKEKGEKEKNEWTKGKVRSFTCGWYM